MLESTNLLEPAAVVIRALHKMGYGHSPQDLERAQRLGLPAYIEEQLHPVDTNDAVLQEKLAKATLAIAYNAGKKKVKEARPLRHLDSSIERLWLVLQGEDIPYEEKVRPAQEVMVATWLRAVYSRWQLREVLVEFWHHHFNVCVSKDERIAAIFPWYDRMVIRKNCLGNFRVFLEEVAQSTAMQYYLNNATSKASPANENYARELLELHTLGAAHYLNHLYNRWREVPGALEGKPVGYIDEDVYEAARAFTGWTIADGTDNGAGKVFEDTGTFYYYEGWHDNYQKRVLATEFPPNQLPLADGKKVLDLLAAHPATAQHLCTKLCRRLVSDNPPESLIKKASKVWLDNVSHPAQIQQVVRVILTSEEFLMSFGQKVKRPFELVAAFLRATQVAFQPNAPFMDMMSRTGYRQFDWLTPTGHPDVATYWLSTNMMLARWNIITVLTTEGWHETTKWKDYKFIENTTQTVRDITTYWVQRMLASPISEATFSTLAHFLSLGGSIDEPPLGEAEEMQERIKQLLALIGMLPEFQIR